jgi:hypothetical protein
MGPGETRNVEFRWGFATFFEVEVAISTVARTSERSARLRRALKNANWRGACVGLLPGQLSTSHVLTCLRNLLRDDTLAVLQDHITHWRMYPAVRCN